MSTEPSPVATRGFFRFEAVRRLLAAGADPSIPDDNGQTAIGIARDHHPDFVEMLEAAHDSPATEP